MLVYYKGLQGMIHGITKIEHPFSFQFPSSLERVRPLLGGSVWYTKHLCILNWNEFTGTSQNGTQIFWNDTGKN